MVIRENVRSELSPCSLIYSVFLNKWSTFLGFNDLICQTGWHLHMDWRRCSRVQLTYQYPFLLFPSVLTATGVPIHNWLGREGKIVAFANFQDENILTVAVKLPTCQVTNMMPLSVELAAGIHTLHGIALMSLSSWTWHTTIHHTEKSTLNRWAAPYGSPLFCITSCDSHNNSGRKMPSLFLTEWETETGRDWVICLKSDR